MIQATDLIYRLGKYKGSYDDYYIAPVETITFLDEVAPVITREINITYAERLGFTNSLNNLIIYGHRARQAPALSIAFMASRVQRNKVLPFFDGIFNLKRNDSHAILFVFNKVGDELSRASLQIMGLGEDTQGQNYEINLAISANLLGGSLPWILL